MLHSKNTIAIPPGATIHEQLEDRGMRQKEFSLRMGMSEKHISQLINGKVALTPEVALRLEAVLGLPAGFWNNLEAIYQEKLARVTCELAMESDCQLAGHFPYAKMAKLGWVPFTKKIEEKVNFLRSFFEVASLNLLDSLHIPGIAYRKLGTNEKSDFALAAWAQKARLEARKQCPAPISIDRLVQIISKIRALTVTPPDMFCEELRNLLLSCGVTPVFLPHIGGSFLHGASFVDSKHIVLGLTVRGKDADIFWFSLFHELHHIIEGHIYNVDGTNYDDELMADCFSRDVLIPADAYARFVQAQDYSKDSIISFADSVQISPGIVVGRLQKEHAIPYNWFTELKVKYEIA